jgi:hypothetical protein
MGRIAILRFFGTTTHCYCSSSPRCSQSSNTLQTTNIVPLMLACISSVSDLGMKFGVIAIITKTEDERCARACPRGKLKLVHHMHFAAVSGYSNLTAAANPQNIQSQWRHPLRSSCTIELTTRKSTFILSVRGCVMHYFQWLHGH